jgi:hypothetical protein
MAARRRGKYTRNPRRSREILAAIDAGVLAAAERYREAVLEYWDSVAPMSDNGALGYISGEYAMGPASDLKITEVRTSRGKRVADVYSDAERDGHPYPVYWELGHDNYFTKNHEVMPIFGPALMFYRSDIVGAMGRQIAARFYTGERKGATRTMIRGKSGMIQVSEP